MEDEEIRVSYNKAEIEGAGLEVIMPGQLNTTTDVLTPEYRISEEEYDE